MTSKTATAPKLAPTVLPDAEYERKWPEESQYQMLRKSHDPRFGEIMIYKKRGTNELIFAKEKLTTSKQAAAADIRELKSRMALNRPGLQSMIGYSTAIKKELCSTSYLTQGFYEFPKSDLGKEISTRSQNGTNYSEAELGNIAQQALRGLNSLHQEKITHSDIRPQYIGFDYATGNTEILDRLADPSPLEKIQTTNIVNKKNLYMSPELYKKLQGKDKMIKYDPAKNDVYGLGLSILEAGNGQSVQDIYNANGSINQANLDRHLQTFKTRYPGGYLSNFVSSSLNSAEASRPTANDLTSYLSAYSVAGGQGGAQGQYGSQYGAQGDQAQYGSQYGTQGGQAQYGSQYGAQGGAQGQYGSQYGAQGQYGSQYGQTTYAAAPSTETTKTVTTTTNVIGGQSGQLTSGADQYAQSQATSGANQQSWTATNVVNQGGASAQGGATQSTTTTTTYVQPATTTTTVNQFGQQAAPSDQGDLGLFDFNQNDTQTWTNYATKVNNDSTNVPSFMQDNSDAYFNEQPTNKAFALPAATRGNVRAMAAAPVQANFVEKTTTSNYPATNYGSSQQFGLKPFQESFTTTQSYAQPAQNQSFSTQNQSFNQSQPQITQSYTAPQTTTTQTTTTQTFVAQPAVQQTTQTYSSQAAPQQTTAQSYTTTAQAAPQQTIQSYTTTQAAPQQSTQSYTTTQAAPQQSSQSYTTTTIHAAPQTTQTYTTQAAPQTTQTYTTIQAAPQTTQTYTTQAAPQSTRLSYTTQAAPQTVSQSYSVQAAPQTSYQSYTTQSIPQSTQSYTIQSAPQTTTQSFVIQPTSQPITTTQSYTIAPQTIQAAPQVTSYYTQAPSSTQYISTAPVTTTFAQPTIVSQPQYIALAQPAPAVHTTYVSAQPSLQNLVSAPVSSQTYISPLPAIQTQIASPFLIQGAPTSQTIIQTGRPMTPAATLPSSQTYIRSGELKPRPMTPLIQSQYISPINLPPNPSFTQVRPLTPVIQTLGSQQNIVSYSKPSDIIISAQPQGISKSERTVATTEFKGTSGLTGYYQPTTILAGSRTEILPAATEVKSRKSVSFVDHDSSKKDYSGIISAQTVIKSNESSYKPAATTFTSQSYTTTAAPATTELKHQGSISWEQFQAMKAKDPSLTIKEDASAAAYTYTSHSAPKETYTTTTFQTQEGGHSSGQNAFADSSKNITSYTSSQPQTFTENVTASFSNQNGAKVSSEAQAYAQEIHYSSSQPQQNFETYTHTAYADQPLQSHDIDSFNNYEGSSYRNVTLSNNNNWDGKNLVLANNGAGFSFSNQGATESTRRTKKYRYENGQMVEYSDEVSHN